MPDRDKELVKEYKATAGIRFRISDAQLILGAFQPMTRSEQYDDIVLNAKTIFVNRNAMYKDAFTAIGLIGTISTLIGDVFRLKYMVYDSDDYGRKYKEQIRDKLLDIINQAIISIFVLDADNYKGK